MTQCLAGFSVFFFSGKMLEQEAQNLKMFKFFLCFLQNPVKYKKCVVSKKLRKSQWFMKPLHFLRTATNTCYDGLLGKASNLNVFSTEGSEITKKPHTKCNKHKWRRYLNNIT